MKCSLCGGYVEWKGPLVNLTHTECHGCGAINSQIPDDEIFDAEVVNPLVSERVDAHESGKTIIGGRRVGKTEAMRIVMAKNAATPAPAVIYRHEDGKLTIQECGDMFTSSRDALQQLFERHNELIDQLAEAREELDDAVRDATNAVNDIIFVRYELKEAREKNRLAANALKHHHMSRPGIAAIVQLLSENSQDHGSKIP